MLPVRYRYLPFLLVLSLLSACAAPLLLLPSQRDLMWALLAPLVGFDPNKVNLFEQPVIKQRMTAMLGSHYEDTMQLLRTADQLQREGPLFFVLSRYSPVPEIASQVGLVWNSDSDHLAAVIRHGDRAEVLSEVVQGAVETAVSQVAPQWPTPISAWLASSPSPDVTPPAVPEIAAPAN